MIILAIRTDKPEAEIGLFDNEKALGRETWQAHRVLAETIHQKIVDLLQASDKTLESIGGIIAFQGPGSFTGLRIGLSVANALAYGLEVPIVATKSETWIEQGIKRLLSNSPDPLALPEYGAPVHITQQKR